MSWLFDTLVWTGALIALVLLIRRTVARYFGARAAYALWALPLLRLVLPPIVLPASMAPSREASVALDVAPEVLSSPATAPVGAVSSPLDWNALLVAVWLIGVAGYIALRLLAYRRLRNALLTDARAVGSAGTIRLIETGATRSPLAFGVIDKVIALPQGFMAQADRAGRDLALAHELAHHRAHDLMANFAALPLFALHWFNPLSWLGWTAMRRDQEAACDARVVEGRVRAERAIYAGLIAGAAASPKFALAAPMACPVLGDKSIVHRLRNLAMNDPSTRRRRAGTWLVGIAALALPLTASISYAQSSMPEAPLPPEAPEVPLPPEAPAAPEAPDAPDALGTSIVSERPDGRQRHVIVVRDVDGKRTEHVIGERSRVVVRNRNGKTIATDSPEFRTRMEALEERLEREIERSIEVDEARIEREAELAEAAAEREADLAEAAAERASAHAERAAEQAVRQAHRFAVAPRAVVDCSGARTADGRHVAGACRSRSVAGALTGLRAARASIAGNRAIAGEVRDEIVKELDREIARFDTHD